MKKIQRKKQTAPSRKDVITYVFLDKLFYIISTTEITYIKSVAFQ